MMRGSVVLAIAAVSLAMVSQATLQAAEPNAAPVLADYFPPPEAQGGWRSLLPAEGDPSDDDKARIDKLAGVDWDKLKEAWDHNTKGEGATGLLVIRRGYIVGEWYLACDRRTDFNVFSCSKSYTSTAFGLILSDFKAAAGSGKPELSLDTKVCNERWIPEALPLTDPRKADITVRHLLNMASGLTEENPPDPPGSTKPFEPKGKVFEWFLGHTGDSPMKTLKNDPGKEFHYSNAGVAHLVLLFQRATGSDLFPFLKQRVLDPIGMQQVRWLTIGGGGAVGPYSQGYSGVTTTAREHARFCYLSMHRGMWAGKRLVPDRYYDFAWAPSPAADDYGAQWWLFSKFPDMPRDMVRAAGFRNNHGYIIPSLDLVFIRVGNGDRYPRDFDRKLAIKVLAAVKK
jgi:CubicO group peptidase (beta-lactamase class C family)